MDTLAYNDNIQDHRAIGDDLGLLQRGIVKGTLTRQTANTYFSGYELAGLLEAEDGTIYLKKDTVSAGGKKDGGANSRTTRRVIVRVGSGDGALVEGFAMLWNHANGFKLLGAGFFTRGETLRNMK